jgi:hypothetical protein
MVINGKTCIFIYDTNQFIRYFTLLVNGVLIILPNKQALQVSYDL